MAKKNTNTVTPEDTTTPPTVKPTTPTPAPEKKATRGKGKEENATATPTEPALEETGAAGNGEAKPKTPGVSMTPTRYYHASKIIRRWGMAAGVTKEMVAELDAEYADGKRANATESEIALKNAWHTLRGWQE